MQVSGGGGQCACVCNCGMILAILDLIAGALTLTVGIISIINGINGYFSQIILRVWVCLFGLAVVVMAFCIPAVISLNMPFLFRNLGKGLFFTFVACLAYGGSGGYYFGNCNGNTNGANCGYGLFFFIVFVYTFALGCLYLFFAILECCGQPCAPQPRPVFINGGCGNCGGGMGVGGGGGRHTHTTTTTVTRGGTNPMRTGGGGGRLPAGGSTAQDPKSGKTYFIDNRTGRTQWHRP